MTFEEIERRIPLEDRYIGTEHIDSLKLHQCMNQHGYTMVLHRAYRRVGERLDLLDGESGWVKLRKAMNRGTE